MRKELNWRHVLLCVTTLEVDNTPMVKLGMTYDDGSSKGSYSQSQECVAAILLFS